MTFIFLVPFPETMLGHSRRTSVLQSGCALHWSSGDCIDHKHVGAAEGFKADLRSPPHTFLMFFTQQLEKRTDLWKPACRIINPRKRIYLKMCIPYQNLRFRVDEMTSGLRSLHDNAHICMRRIHIGERWCSQTEEHMLRFHPDSMWTCIDLQNCPPGKPENRWRISWSAHVWAESVRATTQA